MVLVILVEMFENLLIAENKRVEVENKERKFTLNTVKYSLKKLICC